MGHVIEMKDISIEFPGVKALSNCDFTVRSGEVIALVGANGAGKSTLMKVLAGSNPTYTGEIYFDEKKVDLSKPAKAKELGIEMVYQEVDTALFPALSVAENIMFNYISKVGSKAVIDWGYINQEAKNIIAELNLGIDEKELVSKLNLAQKQMVLIARAIYEKCNFLVLDEPTAPLSMNEVNELFRIVRELSSVKNVGVIFISHRLPELFEICSYITIMRNGKIVADKMKISSELTIKEIVTLMLGRSFEENFPHSDTEPGEVYLEVSNLYGADKKVKDVSLYARRGEIVGISGLVGAGKTELSKLIFGASKMERGEIKLGQKPANIKNTSRAIYYGMALIPEERRKEGVIVTQNIIENLSICALGKFSNYLGFVKKKPEILNAREKIKALTIKTPSESQKVMNLSGGNQQKVAIGKWLTADADIYIMDEPTKGIDVGAKREIFQLISQLAAAGKVIIYISSEISEILAITNRVYVMYSGKIAAELKTSDTTEKEILFYSTGGK